ANRAADLAEGGQLVHRAGEVGGACLQLGKQADILDRDDRLITECLQKFYLGVREPAWVTPCHQKSADGFAFAQHRHRDHAAESKEPSDLLYVLRDLGLLDVGKMDH